MTVPKDTVTLNTQGHICSAPPGGSTLEQVGEIHVLTVRMGLGTELQGEGQQEQEGEDCRRRQTTGHSVPVLVASWPGKKPDLST